MIFKYQNEMKTARLEDCPPNDYAASSIIAFRFVFSEIYHPNNFRPVGLIDPQRLNEFKENPKKCQALGLSMFSEAAKAQDRFDYLQRKTAGKFANIAGSYLATLNLEATDGIHSKRHDSHFTFHEFENVNLADRVIKIENL
ncbi:MAG: hypothetical protein IPJ82_10850 [Lewinellaceae bacterium]|nr:hypothetical protein [Lewinellaceae bacterium]